MTSPEFKRFELELDSEMRKQFRDHIGDVTRKIALQGLQGLVRKSPVDTGLFRSNWMTDDGEPQERTQQAIESAGATISRGSSNIASAEVFGPISIHNSLPYAERLDQGHSQQAPAGLIDITAAELESQFRRTE